MSNDLYFIPLLVRALDSDEPHYSLDDAMADIERRGAQRDHRQGYQQFQEFMSLVTEASESEEDDRLLAALAEFLPRRLDSDGATAAPGASQFSVIVTRDGQEIASLTFAGRSDTQSLHGVMPGEYEMSLGSGRLLWEGALTEADLVWTSARPGEGMPMAADSGVAEDEATIDVPLLEGELRLRVFAGIESGRLVIERSTSTSGGER